MQFRIEHGITIPPKSNSLGFCDTLRKMKKGDSLKLDKKNHKSYVAMAHSVFGTGNYAIRSNGSTVRLWRVK